MADDSDDEKPLFVLHAKSKGSVEVNGSVKHEPSSSLHESQERGINGKKPPKFTLNPSQEAGMVQDENSSSPEPLLRLTVQKVQSVKVYTKRKKQAENENLGAKKPKLLQVTSNDRHSSVSANRQFDQKHRPTVNANNISEENVCTASTDVDDGQIREHDGNTTVGKIVSADFRESHGSDSRGGTQDESTEKNLADDVVTTVINPKASFNLTQIQCSLSKAEMQIQSDKEQQEEDDDLPLSKMSHFKKRKESVRQDLDQKENLDDNVSLTLMSTKKFKSSVMNGGQAILKQTVIKEECQHTKLKKFSNVKEVKQLADKLADVSEKKMHKPANGLKDSIENRQLHYVSPEDENDDNLTLVQMSRLKRKDAASGVQVSGAKEQAGRKKDKLSIPTAHTKLLFEETLGKLPHTRSDNFADTTKDASGKCTDVSVGVVCMSRAKQLIALSRALEDTESEDEQEKGEESKDDNGNEDEEEEDEDEDDDYIGSKAGKVTTLKSRSRAKVSSGTLKVKFSGQSKAHIKRTAKNISQRRQKYDYADADNDNDDDVDVEEDVDDDDDESSQDEDDEWEDDEEYDVMKVSKRKKKKGAQHKQARKQSMKVKDLPGAEGGQKWTTLQHNGVMFPPFYQSHGVKMLYQGNPVDLTLEEEEVATMFALMKETDYATKPKFLANFWNDWKKILGSNHIIQKLEDCNFTPIYEWHLAEKEKKKQISSQEKKLLKEEKLKQEEKYMWAVVDGMKEKVGNFRVEPPGLFRGRGEHPKMGKLKRRIYPEDIVINIGADAPIPECPLPGHRWKEVRHDDTVTWLAYWNDPINTKEQKYVFLSPSSALKGQSDKEKYEKARMLKDYIEDIRKTYTENFTSADSTSRQIAVATYLIDQLALRAGNEKDDDEADTVGCCSLKVEHVTLIPPTSLQFDFLGKDSIRYFNVVEVVKPVYVAVGDFKKDKSAGSDLFDRLDTSKLNAYLKNIMPQLTAKVFRTYNASITLDNLLLESGGRLLAERIASYQRANKEVAVLCNHQRSVSKSHGSQMEKLEGKLAELTDLVDELQQDLERVRMGKEPLKDSEGNAKKLSNPDVLEKKILQTRQKMERMTLDMKIKEDLKTVALGTSKINYMDPRITVAWCKKLEVPIEKIFNKSLLAKFAWSMDVDLNFRF